MDNQQLAQTILKFLGGAENVRKANHCMTRLRATVKNPELVNLDSLKQTANVLGVVNDNDYFQIVLGPGKAQKVTEELWQLGLSRDEARVENVDEDLNNWQANKQSIKNAQKQSKLRDGLKVIAEIFIPLLPAVISAGLFFGLGSLISQLLSDQTVSGQFWEMAKLLFQTLGGAFLGYFAIFTGVRSAHVFGATPALGGMIGGLSISPNIVEISKILGLYSEEVPLNSILTTGKGGIIGVIFGVWILSKVEKFIRKRIPDVLDLIVVPFLSMLIMGVLFIFAIMPLAGFVSDGLVSALSLIINSSSPVVRIISGYILAAVFLPMVLLGLHHGLIPIYAVQLEQMGGVSLFPVLAMAGAGQVGAAIAIYLVAKKVGNRRLQSVITGALPAGFLGVGEPLIYGVTLPLFKPFITAGLGAGFGGAYVMLTQVMAGAWGPSGLVATPLMQGTKGMLNYLVGLVVAYIGGFIITKLMIKDDEVRSI